MRSLPFFGLANSPFHTFGKIEVVVENGFILVSFGGDGHVLLNHVLVEQDTVGVFEQSSAGPHEGENEIFLVLFIGGVFVKVDVGVQKSGEEIQELSHADDVGDFHNGGFDGLDQRLEEFHIRDVFGEKHVELFVLVTAVKFEFTGSDPGLDHGFVAEVGGGNEDLSAPGDGGGGGVIEILDFEHHLAVLCHGNALTVGESQNLVVVEHGVKILDPNGIDWSVTDDPSVELVGTLVGLLP